MGKALEMARELVKYLEEKENSSNTMAEAEESNLVKLSDLAAGETFKTDIGEFIVLEQFGEVTKVITKELYKENVTFCDCNDYRKSNVRKVCEKDILNDFESVFGMENIVEHDANLTTVDGQKMFGTITSKVRPLTFDEVRRYNAVLVNKNLPDWYWTTTAWSSEERGWKYSIAVVSPSGGINSNCCDCNGGVRPVCILKSNIFVSK